MALSIREFSERVEKICDRWSVKSRSITVVSDAGVKSFNEPIQVWERPYAKGEGFSTDTLVMEFNGAPSISHLKKLRQGHWYRTQELQKSIFELCREEQMEKKRIGSSRTSYDTRQIIMEHRKGFREKCRRLGLSRGSMRANQC